MAERAERADGAAAPSSARAVDAALAARVRAGDEAALGELYARYGARAWSLAKRVCVDDQIAEDVVQEAFVAFWRDPGRFDPDRGGFGTWLLTVVHHRAVDAVRRESGIRRRSVTLDEAVTPAEPGADLAALGAVVAGQVRAALGQLPGDQRRALALAYFGGYTQREVAVLTGVPLGTVKSRMFTGLARLRTLLAGVTG